MRAICELSRGKSIYFGPFTSLIRPNFMYLGASITARIQPISARWRILRGFPPRWLSPGVLLRTPDWLPARADRTPALRLVHPAWKVACFSPGYGISNSSKSWIWYTSAQTI